MPCNFRVAGQKNHIGSFVSVSENFFPVPSGSDSGNIILSHDTQVHPQCRFHVTVLLYTIFFILSSVRHPPYSNGNGGNGDSRKKTEQKRQKAMRQLSFAAFTMTAAFLLPCDDNASPGAGCSTQTLCGSNYFFRLCKHFVFSRHTVTAFRTKNKIRTLENSLPRFLEIWQKYYLSFCSLYHISSPVFCRTQMPLLLLFTVFVCKIHPNSIRTSKHDKKMHNSMTNNAIGYVCRVLRIPTDEKYTAVT